MTINMTERFATRMWFTKTITQNISLNNFRETKEGNKKKKDFDRFIVGVWGGDICESTREMA